MENASKALIIAGAVLISILLITIGIVVINMVNGNIDQAGDELLTQEATQFNSKFTSLAGSQRASTVKQLLTNVMSNNGKAEGGHYIEVKVSGTNAPSNPTPSLIQSKLKSSEKYTVTVEDKGTPSKNATSGLWSINTTPDGYIDTITIDGTFSS